MDVTGFCNAVIIYYAFFKCKIFSFNPDIYYLKKICDDVPREVPVYTRLNLL